MIKSSALLTIQKFIYLLDDFHYHEFVRHLSSTNALLPLKLVESIRSQLPGFNGTNELCRKVYNTDDKAHRQNFNQLSSYSFKLSSVLAQNYPSYLHHNTTRLQRLVNEGKREEANLLAESLLDIAERIEDFQCQISVLKFLGQQAFLIRDIPTGVRLNSLLETAVEKENIFVQLQSYYRIAFLQSDIATNPATFKKFRQYYQHYLSHPSPVIRIYSSYVCVSALYHYHAELFGTDENSRDIRKLEKDLNNYDYLVFPYMSDLIGNFGFIKLNSIFVDFNSKEGQKSYDELSRYYNSIKFWKNYLNFGQMHLFAIQTSRLMSTYHYQLHRSDYREIITETDARMVDSLIEKSEEMLLSDTSKQYYEYEMRSLKMLHAALLLFRGGASIRKGVNEIETLLTVYQQINMKAATDSIYLCLMFGYFALKEYEKCAQTFKRYMKVIKGKSTFEGNDSKIHAYYYISQWLATGSRQYVVKLQALLQERAGKGPHSTIRELARYLNISLEPVAVAG